MLKHQLFNRKTEASLKTARNSNSLVAEQADIARDQKSDYQNYTRATIENGRHIQVREAWGR